MMKIRHLLSFVAMCALALSATSCANNPFTTAGTDLTNLWNSPAVQAEIANAERIAMDFFANWFATHLGASRNARSTSGQSAINGATAAIRAQHPDMPDSVARNIAAAKFAGH
jgi:hypothetical protein